MSPELREAYIDLRICELRVIAAEQFCAPSGKVLLPGPVLPAPHVRRPRPRRDPLGRRESGGDGLSS
jgi:hypothetical protein